MPKKFEHTLTIKEKHLDTFGHVNNAVYLELYEQARWDFITEEGYGLNEVQNSGLGPVILELNLKFKAEIKNREEIRIESQFKELKNPLVMVLSQKMINAQNKVASELELIVGIMDLRKRKLVRPHIEWLKAIGLSEKEVSEIFNTKSEA